MIRIAFRYDDKRIFARLVCLVQGGDSAHCEVADDWNDGNYDCVSASWLDGGVRSKIITMTPEKWRIYELPIDNDRVIEWYAVNKGMPYDSLGLLGFFIRRISGIRKAWFCSEVAADIIGLSEPHRYDLALLESVCARFGTRVQ